MFQSIQRRGNGISAPQVNLAPLMDMVFILLIFFIVTTTFVKETGIRVDRPRAAASQSLESKSLRVAITKGGAVYTEGRRVELAELRERIKRFVAREKSPSVILIPDEATSAGRLVEVMDAAKLAGARDLAVAARRRGAR